MCEGSTSQDQKEEIPLVSAATVLLLREKAGSPVEVLMLRRNSKIAFGGMWVFPGGRVDEHELDHDDELGSARRAAVRETEEEAGLVVTATDMVTWSYWEPPPREAMYQKGPLRRFSTWFFAAPAPPGVVSIDDGEITEHAWLAPEEALSQHRAGEIELVPPTWITLTQLRGHKSVSSALTWASTSQPRKFCTRPISKKPLILAWDGDHAYERPMSDESDGTDPHLHRLVMHSDGWIYHDTVGS